MVSAPRRAVGEAGTGAATAALDACMQTGGRAWRYGQMGGRSRLLVGGQADAEEDGWGGAGSGG